METCDLLVHSKILLTQDEERTVLRDHSLAVRNGVIAEILPRAQSLAKYAPSRKVEGGLVLPGLANSHTHAAMTFARGLGDDLPLMEWLERRIFPAEAKLTREITHAFSLLGHAEMLAHGITACMDMYIFEDAVFDAARTAGIRLVGGEAIFGFPSAACKNYREALAAGREMAEDLRSSGRLRYALNPHSVYTTDKTILRAVAEEAAKSGLALNIHLAETEDEIALCREKTGLRPVEYCETLGLFDLPCTVAHAVHLTPQEIETLAKKNARVAHNPSSNMKLASGVAPVAAMLRAGVAVGLGTDGAASNNQLNIFTEMGRAALLHKVHERSPTVLSAQTVLDMATLHGAQCLHWPELGRIAQGGVADFISLDMTAPNLAPMHNPVSQVVYAASGHECDLTVVDGEILFEKGRFTRFSYEDLLEEIDDRLSFVQNRA